MWTTRRLKISSPLSSGNPFPETGDKNNPRAATRTSSSSSLMDPEPRDEHTPTAHPCPILALWQADVGGLHPEHPTLWEKNLRTELATGPYTFGDTKDLLVLVVTSSHLCLLLYCLYISLIPELPPLPSFPWSCPPCSFPPVLAFLPLLFIFSLYPHSKTSFPPLRLI